MKHAGWVFDLAALLQLPFSRIAQKHRDHAEQLGVNHYLGKPYSEEELLALIAQCIESRSAAPVA